MFHSFIRASRLRRWLARTDCPPAIKECRVLFDKLAPPTEGVDFDETPSGTCSVAGIPPDLLALLAGRSVTLRARLKYDGVFYTRSLTHLGNSLILFYRGGDAAAAPIAGRIKYIFVHENKFRFAVQHYQLAEEGTVDPFQHYIHLPVKIYSSTLHEQLEEVQVDWVHGHFALYPISHDRIAALSLSRVSSDFLVHLLMLMFL